MLSTRKPRTECCKSWMANVGFRYLSSVENNAGEVFIFCRSEMVKSLVNALIIHLITFLCQTGQVGMVPDLLDNRISLVL